jgi:hypothetical protein
MPDYRLYFLGLDGHFRKAEPILAANDIDAMKATREFTDGSELKLWEGNRKIVAFGSDQPQIVSSLSPSSYSDLQSGRTYASRRTADGFGRAIAGTRSWICVSRIDDGFARKEKPPDAGHRSAHDGKGGRDERA